jgi:hypothetical protein
MSPVTVTTMFMACSLRLVESWAMEERRRTAATVRKDARGYGVFQRRTPTQRNAAAARPKR